MPWRGRSLSMPFVNGRLSVERRNAIGIALLLRLFRSLRTRWILVPVRAGPRGFSCRTRAGCSTEYVGGEKERLVTVMASSPPAGDNSLPECTSSARWPKMGNWGTKRVKGQVWWAVRFGHLTTVSQRVSKMVPRTSFLGLIWLYPVYTVPGTSFTSPSSELP